MFRILSRIAIIKPCGIDPMRDVLHLVTPDRIDGPSRYQIIDAMAVRAGDALEVVGPDLRPVAFAAGGMTTAEGEPLEEPRTPQSKFYIRLPCKVPALSMLRRSVDLSAK